MNIRYYYNKSTPEWAKELNVPVKTLRVRIKKLGPEKALQDIPYVKFQRHGYTNRGKIRPEYRVWAAIIQRCKNTKLSCAKDYSLRGIKVCERWLDFVNFIADVGPRPLEIDGNKNITIERIDNDGNYEPSNVIWTTRKQNQRNRRFNQNHTYQGKTQCIAAWAQEYGMSYSGLYGRLQKGMTIEQSLTLPIPFRKKPEKSSHIS